MNNNIKQMLKAIEEEPNGKFEEYHWKEYKRTGLSKGIEYTYNVDSTVYSMTKKTADILKRKGYKFKKTGTNI